MIHDTVVVIAQDPADSRIQGDEWNADHIFVERAEPADGDVTDNTSFPWMSNGTGAGTRGDIMIKIKSNGVVKTVTWIPFSLVT